MDIFIEEMVKKHKTTSAKLLSAGSIVLGLLFVILLFAVIFPLFYQFSSLILVLAAVILYGIYTLASSFNVEYEYSLVNSEMDIDQITNRKKRKHLATVSLHGLESFGTLKNPDFSRYAQMTEVKKIYACRDKSAEDTFFLVANIGTAKTMLVFSPNEKIKEQIAKRNPKKPMI